MFPNTQMGKPSHLFSRLKILKSYQRPPEPSLQSSLFFSTVDKKKNCEGETKRKMFLVLRF